MLAGAKSGAGKDQLLSSKWPFFQVLDSSSAPRDHSAIDFQRGERLNYIRFVKKNMQQANNIIYVIL